MNYQVIKIGIVFSGMFILNHLGAQSVVKVKDVTGKQYISGDESPNQAKKDALNDAKINALKKAGIAENISSYQMLFTSQVKNDYSQFFKSDIQSDIQGAVKSYTMKSDTMYMDKFNNPVYEVTIDAEVIKYDTKADRAFDVNVDGIMGVYINNTNLSFTVKTTQACYLTIFNITDKDALVLFPNDYEKQRVLNPDELLKFPFADINYNLTTDLPQETNRLIFVFTKTSIPFIKQPTNDNIFTWIYSIMPDQRKVEYFTLLIQK